MPALGTALIPLAIPAHAYYLEYLVLVQVLEPAARYHVLVVLLRVQQARLLQALAVERVRVLEYIAHVLHADVLGEDVLALTLDGGNAEAVREGQQVVQVLGLHAGGVGAIAVDVPQHEEEGVEGDAVVVRGEVDHALLCFLEVVRKEGLEVERAGGQDHAVAVQRGAIEDKRDIWEGVRVVEHRQEVLWLGHSLVVLDLQGNIGHTWCCLCLHSRLVLLNLGWLRGRERGAVEQIQNYRLLYGLLIQLLVHN